MSIETSIDVSGAKPDLWGALAKAQKAAGTVGKDGENTQRGYRYASAEAVIREGRKILAEQGMALVTSWLDLEPRASAGDIGQQHVASMVQIDWVLGHEGGGMLAGRATMAAIGSRARPPDKAVAATVTYGLGFVVRGLLMLDRGEEDEMAVDQRQEPEADPIWDRFAVARDRMVRVLGVTEAQALEMAAVAAKITLQKGKNETDAELVAMTKSADMLLGAAERKAELEAKHKAAKTAWTVAGRKWMTTQRADYKDAEGEKASPDIEAGMQARALDISALAAQVDKWPGLRDATTEQLEAAADALRSDLAGPGDPDA